MSSEISRRICSVRNHTSWTISPTSFKRISPLEIFPEKAFSIVGANGYEIRAALRIVVIGQSDGSSAIFGSTACHHVSIHWGCNPCMTNNRNRATRQSPLLELELELERRLCCTAYAKSWQRATIHGPCFLTLGSTRNWANFRNASSKFSGSLLIPGLITS